MPPTCLTLDNAEELFSNYFVANPRTFLQHITQGITVSRKASNGHTYSPRESTNACHLTARECMKYSYVAFHLTNLFLFFYVAMFPPIALLYRSPYKPSATHNSLIRSYEGPTLEMSAFNLSTLTKLQYNSVDKPNFLSTTQSDSIVRQTNKRSSYLSYTTMNNKHIFDDNQFSVFDFRTDGGSSTVSLETVNPLVC